MRIITGDECGLLKEVIPELCRPVDKDSAALIHKGRARPSATSIQAAASSYGNSASTSATGQHRAPAVQRLETNPEAQSRERGVISLAFLPINGTTPTSDDNNDRSSAFQFAALRMNGIVETWSGNRVPSSTSSYNDEVNVTAATYKRNGGLVKSVLPQQKNDSDDGNENAVSSSKVEDSNDENESSTNDSNGKSCKGWYMQQPIRPIGMVSNTTNASSENKNSILTTCDSIGTISLINANNMSKGVVATYNAFDIDIDSILSPSSSKNNSSAKGTLTYTKGGFANTCIATALALCGESEKIAVGGRERGMRILDLESGKLLWKV